MLISTPEALNRVCRDAFACGSVALDTEFVWQRTYHPQLGLVQIALPGRNTFLIDAVAMPQLDGLGELLASPRVKLILHDALQDLQILARHTGASPVNIFDTRRAAGFAGLASTTSLANLLRDLLQIEIDKDATRSNWLQRPLTESQIRYAHEDVRYLHEVAASLEERIRANDFSEALAEEMGYYDEPRLYEPITTTALYTRFRTDRMPHAARSRLFSLLHWRENEARRGDRPRGHIMPDADLLQLANDLSSPTSTATGYGQQKCLVPKRYATHVQQAIQHASTIAHDELPEPDPSGGRIAPAIKQATERRRLAMQERAQAAGIDPALIANRSEIIALILHEANLGPAPAQHICQGWRLPFLAPPPATGLPAQGELPIQS